MNTKLISVTENNDPAYHLKEIQKIHMVTLLDIDTMCIFLQKGSKPCVHTITEYTRYVTDQLKKFNGHLIALRKLKENPCLSDYSIQNFGGIIHQFLQKLKFHHEHN